MGLARSALLLECEADEEVDLSVRVGTMPSPSPFLLGGPTVQPRGREFQCRFRPDALLTSISPDQ